MSQAANLEASVGRICDRGSEMNDQPKSSVNLLEDIYRTLKGKESFVANGVDMSSDLSVMAINKAKLLEAMITVMSKIGNGTYDLEHPHTLREKMLSSALRPFGCDKISKNGGHIQLDRSEEKTVNLGKVPLTFGKHVSFDLDAKDVNHVKVKNIQGMSVDTPLGKTPVRELSMDRDANGKAVVTATIEVGGKLVKLPPVPLPVRGMLVAIG